MTRIPLADLHAFVVAAFVACGLEEDQAATAAAAVCYADQRGITTHGVDALARIYAPRLRDGRISRERCSRVMRESRATALVDGQRRLGLLVGTEAVDVAVDKAGANGVSVVAVRGSSHFGCAGFYASRAAAHGMIGLAMTNCGAQGIAPPLGGTRRLLGSNPIGAAVPTRQAPPFVLDMSTTVAATGKLRAARVQGQAVPAGWLRRPDGTTTTDPEDWFTGAADLAWLGSSAETGAAKGFGLGLLVELLCGALSGAAVGPSQANLNRGNAPDEDVGQFFLAIDPDAFVGRRAFTATAEQVLGAVASCPPAPWADAVTYPGQLEAQRARSAAEVGVTLPDHVTGNLEALAADLGIAPPRALAPA